ncbi:glycosyltransferase family 1 protein [Kineobactrum sediminis]|uniref:Glycosyltransferase family 1 protein n=1 Tax=Kineobactrum sediminis TaxID=1905677 RepID=A0A2N5Y5J6_9GAMM|nr:glycosyltransferase family 4 protein [Kineobactrum sediminis]PLW83670.1 glycosyltransferase family 1 protein [Kineobactrum sediminis]
MKVLCITDCPDRAETELFIRLSQAAAVDIFTVMSNPAGRYHELLLEAGVNVIPLRISSRFDREGTRAIRAEVYRGGYDIVHAFNTRAVAGVLRAARRHPAKLLGYRGVTTGVGYLKPESWHTFLSPRLDGIFCVAEAVRQSLVSVKGLWWHFPEHKAKTIHKGHELAWYSGEPADLTGLGVPPGATTLCCISRDSAKKGLLTLLDAFDNLPAELSCHLLIIGGVDSNQAVRARASACRYPDRVHFTGYRNDAVAIVRAADLLVSASASGEGLPRVVIEAMCTGTPVVATDAGGTRELVIDGATGLLVPAKNPDALSAAITRALTDPQATQQRVIAARERIENEFSAARTVTETLAWYQDLLATG